MITKFKIEKLATYSFLNGLRLHEDSIFLFKKRSLPSAFQLSILAQEEIGKAFVFNDLIIDEFDKGDYNLKTRKIDIVEKGLSTIGVQIIEWVLSSHQMKQGSFSREAEDFTRARFYKNGKIIRPKIVEEIYSGKLDIKKQNTTFVGLKRLDNKKFDLDGKIINPQKMTLQKVKEIFKHITRVNDFIIEFIEKCRRDIASVDSDLFDDCLTLKIVKRLEKKWPYKNKLASPFLEKIRENPIGS